MNLPGVLLIKRKFVILAFERGKRVIVRGNERGAVSLPVILASVFAVGLAASGYLNYYQHQSATQSQKQLQGQITDLTYQVNQDRQTAALGASPSATPTPLATPEPSPTPTPAVAGTGSVSLSQFGVKLTVTDPVADLTYAMATSGAYPVAALTTKSLVAKYTSCAPSNANNALGQIVKKPVGKSSTGKLIRQVGVYNYFYLPPTGSCATDQAGLDVLAADRAAIKNATLPTLSN